MQAFSARNFQLGSPGYDRYWYDTAVELGEDHTSSRAQSWSQQALKPLSETESGIDLDQLVRFFSHPIRYFFNSRLGIWLVPEDVDEDDESFALQSLDKWALAMRLANDRLSGADPGVERLRAEGMLPHGHAAENAWHRLQSDYRDLLEQLENYRSRESVPRSVECRLDNGLSLFGEVRGCYPGTGLLHFSASKSVKSRALLSLWLNHLALCASDQLAEGETSQLVTAARKQGLNFPSMASTAAAELLTGYVELYRLGLEKPLPVFPDTSYAWASEPDPDRAMNKALITWRGGDYRNAAPGECEDEFVRLALHRYAAHPLDDPMFSDYASRIYRPPLAQRGQND